MACQGLKASKNRIPKPFLPKRIAAMSVSADGMTCVRTVRHPPIRHPGESHHAWVPTRNRWMESFGVVKDDPDGMAMARAHAAHAVTHVHPIYAFRSPHRAVMHGEDHGITLRERYHFCA